MSLWRRIFKRKRRSGVEIHEVFMDMENLPEFNTQQFEGVLESAIPKKTFYALGALVIVVFTIFALRLIKVQVVEGKNFFTISERNRLDSIPIFAERGVIFDRNGLELAWNVPSENDEPFFHRAYYNAPGFAHILGYIEYPKKDAKGIYWRTELAGKSGVEKLVNDRLQGTNGAKLIETNALNEQQSESMVIAPVQGQNISLTIDANVQSALHAGIEDMATTYGFEGGAGVIMNVATGEILALVSYPEFNPQVLSEGTDAETIKGYFSDPAKPFLNRALSGLYTPGSIIKPYLAIAALQEGLVTPDTVIQSIGRITVPNPYNPDAPTIFRDWRPEGHGPTDLNHAIADSVNTYFYAIGGGYGGQTGLGITKMDRYINLFQIGKRTGVDMEGEVAGIIPNPDWKKKMFKDGSWRLGDTYNTSIGQYGFQVTPIQMVRSTAALANGGTLVRPYVMARLGSQQLETIEGIDPQYYADIREAMRTTVTNGTAARLNVPYVAAAAKTGTAQVGRNNEFENSWVTGFFPYENPRYAFVVVMEKGPDTNETGASYVMQQVFAKMNMVDTQYFK